MHTNFLHFLVATACVLHSTRLTVGQQHIDYYIDNNSSKDSEPLEEAYLLQAQLFKLQNKIPEAIASIDQALLLKPNFAEALKVQQLILLLKP